MAFACGSGSPAPLFEWCLLRQFEDDCDRETVLSGCSTVEVEFQSRSRLVPFDLPVAPERREESMEWVIETYRKHQLVKVTSWLDENLGKGRRNKILIQPEAVFSTYHPFYGW